MSSFKNSSKAGQRIHKERSQLAARQKFGFLEKKKDYKLRARDHEEKRKKIRELRKRALERNPDEFYFHMINSQVEEDGIHREKDKEEEEAVTEDQIKLMQTQDLRYITFKRTMEAKKIEKMRSSLHCLEKVSGEVKNVHKFFVDTPREVEKFDVAKRLDTAPELLGMRHNRPRLATLKTKNFVVDEETKKAVKEIQRQTYTEFAHRVEREKKLFTICQKMEVKRHLANKKESAPKRIQRETKLLAPVYQWTMERKR